MHHLEDWLKKFETDRSHTVMPSSLEIETDFARARAFFGRVSYVVFQGFEIECKFPRARNHLGRANFEIFHRLASKHKFGRASTTPGRASDAKLPYVIWKPLPMFSPLEIYILFKLRNPMHGFRIPWENLESSVLCCCGRVLRWSSSTLWCLKHLKA